MIEPLIQYLRDEGFPRLNKIVLTWETAISLFVAFSFWQWGNQLFSLSPKVGDLTTGLIAYAAIALGFCVAGLTISLTIPDQDFASKLAVLKKDEESTNAYSDLLFVFSWTAIAHWFALVVLFALTLFTESNGPLLPAGHSSLRGWIVSFVACVCTYCLCQFLITLITLSQIGNVYITHLIECHTRKSGPSASTTATQSLPPSQE
jgi:hypothetical protein